MNIFRNDEKADQVSRISFNNSPKGLYQVNSIIKVILIIADEFQNSLSLIKDLDLDIWFSNTTNNVDLNCHIVQYDVTDDYRIIMRIKAPKIEGKYKLHFKTSSNIEGKITSIVLPLESSIFQVIKKEKEKTEEKPRITNESNTCFTKMSIKFPSLDVFRILQIPNTTITNSTTASAPAALESYGDRYVVRVKESYGMSMGSQVWDSCVVLARAIYFNGDMMLQSKNRSDSTCIDLGAGTGLLGIWIHHTFKYNTTILTDKYPTLIQLLEENIKLNYNCNQHNLEESYESGKRKTGLIVRAFDWADSVHLENILTCCDSEIDTILASDVLYDTEASKQLFQVLECLVSPSTEVYLAQRLRNGPNVAPASDVKVLCKAYGMQVPQIIRKEGGCVVYKIVKEYDDHK